MLFVRKVSIKLQYSFCIFTEQVYAIFWGFHWQQSDIDEKGKDINITLKTWLRCHGNCFEKELFVNDLVDVK